MKNILIVAIFTFICLFSIALNISATEEAKIDEIIEDKILTDDSEVDFETKDGVYAINQGDVIRSDKSEPVVDMTSNEGKISIDSSLEETIEDSSTDDGSNTFETQNTSLETKVYEDGSQFLYTMENSEAPNTFEVNLTLPEGTKIVQDEAGNYNVVDQNGELVIAIGKPWPKDSNGNNVETYYVVEGNKIIQHINPINAEYPIIADPLFCSNTMGNISWDAYKEIYKDAPKNTRGAISTVPNTCTRVYLVTTVTLLPTSSVIGNLVIKDAWGEISSDKDYISHATTSEQKNSVYRQFICHANIGGAITQKTWDFEVHRPLVSWTKTYTSLCNPK